MGALPVPRWLFGPQREQQANRKRQFGQAQRWGAEIEATRVLRKRHVRVVCGELVLEFEAACDEGAQVGIWQTLGGFPHGEGI